MTLIQNRKEANFYFCSIRSVISLSLSLQLHASRKRGSLAHFTAPECFFFNCWRQSHGYLLQHSSLMVRLLLQAACSVTFKRADFQYYLPSQHVSRGDDVWSSLSLSLSPCSKRWMETENRKSVNGVAWSM